MSLYNTRSSQNHIVRNNTALWFKKVSVKMKKDYDSGKLLHLLVFVQTLIGLLKKFKAFFFIASKYYQLFSSHLMILNGTRIGRISISFLERSNKFSHLLYWLSLCVLIERSQEKVCIKWIRIERAALNLFIYYLDMIKSQSILMHCDFPKLFSNAVQINLSQIEFPFFAISYFIRIYFWTFSPLRLSTRVVMLHEYNSTSSSVGSLELAGCCAVLYNKVYLFSLEKLSETHKMNTYGMLTVYPRESIVLYPSRKFEYPNPFMCEERLY